VSFAAVLGFTVSALLAEAARDAAFDDVVQEARDAGQVLTDTVSDKQLTDPVEGASYVKLANRIRRSMSSSPSVVVTVWSSRGRILFSFQKSLLGTTEPEMRPVISQMSTASGSYRVNDSSVRAFVPELSTRGQVVLVEVGEPRAIVEARIGKVWTILRLVFASGLAVSLLLLGLSFASRVKRVAASENDEPSAPDEPHEDAVAHAKVDPEIEPPTIEPAPTQQAVTERASGSFAQALSALEALQPDVGHQVQREAAQNDVRGNPAAEGGTPREAAADEPPDDVSAAQELLRKRREEFKERAAKAELRVKKQEAEVQQTDSGPEVGARASGGSAR